MITTQQSTGRIARGAKAAAAVLLAAGILAASAAPFSAAAASTAMWPQSDVANDRGRVSAFHHHFYRGTQHRYTQDLPRADMMAVADDEAEPMDEGMAYCADRFRSYDPTTGSYLGYDGNEHACP